MTELKSRLARLMGHGEGKLTYDEGRMMLDHPNPAVRLSLAKRADLDTEMLFFLAGDPDPEVRLAVANNPAIPSKGWLILAEDKNREVRVALAQRLPAVLGTASTVDVGHTLHSLTSALRVLVRDELPSIRMILCETLREMPDAPHEIIVALANDPLENIALPILELSSVLTDSDLIEIISKSPLTSAMTSICRRQAVSERVSDALVNSGDPKVIESLLRNPSAFIREQTLDSIADMAPAHPAWHEPLVRRPRLSDHVAKKLCRFVAEKLVHLLTARTDLDPSTLLYINQTMLARIEKRGPGRSTHDPIAAATSDNALRLALFRAESLRLNGRLTPESITKTIIQGLSPLAIAMLSVQAGIPVKSVARSVQRGSARELLAIAWAAQLSPDQAVIVQRELGRVSPEAIIRPAPLGYYAASDSELGRHVAELRGDTMSAA